MTGVVTLQAYRASRHHRAVVEQVLAQYVSFVAHNVKGATQAALFDCADYWLFPAVNSSPDPVTALRTDEACGSKDGGRFDLDLQSRSANRVIGIDREQLLWLLDTIPANAETTRDEQWHIGMIIMPVNGRAELVSYAVKKNGTAEQRAIGFIALGALDHIWQEAQQNVELPEQMHAVGKLTDYFFVSASSLPVKASLEASLFTQTRTLGSEFGNLLISVGLLPAGLQQLAPEGLPPDRGLEFFALFTLAVGLVLSSLLLLRREAQLARTRADFVSGVSHELRTPLAQIRMFAEMLLLGRVRTEADRRRSLEIIDTEARRLSQLVENVLQVARSENGHLRVNPTTMAVAPILNECVETFSVLAQARGIEFRTEMQRDLVAPVDSAALRQIVLNLLDNAAKYGPDGQRIVVGAALYDDTARIWVDDEGPGVPVRERQRVFDPFYRMRDTKSAGSGIGLAVVRELVALHGGNAWIDDAPDGGTRVVVQFPGAYLSAEMASGDFAVA